MRKLVLYSLVLLVAPTTSRARKSTAPVLGTAVLEKGKDGWKIVHWHTSAPRKKAAEAK